MANFPQLISINKNEIFDVLDYRFYCTEKKIKLLIEDENGKPVYEYDQSEIKNERYLQIKEGIMDYIDDQRYENFPMFKKNPKMAKWLSPAIVQVKDFFADIYNSIYEDDI